MNEPTANSFDLTGDLHEIGLMAAASPDFIDAMVRALLAAGEEAAAASVRSEASTTKIAA